jgi:8-oxo-dGTP pyrophosphatase MutT (NUDIX family)
MTDDDAIPAATLIVVREIAGAAPQLLMVERAPGMAFAGGALVFPGGRIDEADRALASHLALGDDGAARVAAIRETIEETAVPAGLKSPPRPEHCLDIQAALAGDGDFAGIVEQAGLSLDLDALTPFARWVPRFHARRRFDTLFFVARAPHGEWAPNAIERECTGAYWLSAMEVLERDRAGTAQLIFPTRRTLERLAQHASFEAIVADARAHRIEAISPWVEEQAGERFIAIPEGIGYPVTREKLDGLWRG